MKRPIIIKQNGKITEIKEPESNIDSTNKETAATLQESNEKDKPVLERKPTLEKVSVPKKKSSFRMYKPAIIAICSAIIIGCVLSVIMFQVFVNVEAGLNEQSVQSIPALATDKNQDNDAVKTGEANIYSFDQIHGFILQTGVFSEQENADTWANHFEGIPMITWQRDNQYFLLSGIAPSQEAAEQLVGTLNMQDEDYFIKEWTVAPLEIELTEEEYNWLQTFHKALVTAIQKVGEDEGGALDEIKSLSSIQSDKLSPLVDEVTSIKDSNSIEIQQSLLNLLYQYEMMK